jgi:hypothetical protein
MPVGGRDSDRTSSRSFILVSESTMLNKDQMSKKTDIPHSYLSESESTSNIDAG